MGHLHKLETEKIKSAVYFFKGPRAEIRVHLPFTHVKGKWVFHVQMLHMLIQHVKHITMFVKFTIFK